MACCPLARRRTSIARPTWRAVAGAHSSRLMAGRAARLAVGDEIQPTADPLPLTDATFEQINNYLKQTEEWAPADRPQPFNVTSFASARAQRFRRPPRRKAKPGRMTSTSALKCQVPLSESKATKAWCCRRRVADFILKHRMSCLSHHGRGAGTNTSNRRDGCAEDRLRVIKV